MIHRHPKVDSKFNEIVDIIEKTPGISYSENIKKSDTSSSNVLWHINRARKLGLIVRVKISHRHQVTFFSTKKQISDDSRRILTSLYGRNKEIKFHILDILRTQGPMRRVHLAKNIGVIPNVLDWHVKLLQNSGVVKIEKLSHNSSLISINEGKWMDELAGLIGTKF